MPRNRPISPPDGLDELSRSIWRAAQRVLKRQGTWQDSDAPLLEAYVRALQTARDCRRAVGNRTFVQGSVGQPVSHPGMRLAAEAERDACRYAQALLLTPEMRKRHELDPSPAEESDPLFRVA